MNLQSTGFVLDPAGNVVVSVAAQRDYAVDWRFISLRMINSHIDYGAISPSATRKGTPRGCGCSGLRPGSGPSMAGPRSGRSTRPSAARSSTPQAAGLTPAVRGSRAFVEPLLAKADLPAGLADALDDTRWDDEIRIEGDEALTLTGRDVGTPIIQFSPPEGTAFFGPVISRLPAPEDAVRLWDHVTGLAGFPGFAGFAELKRSLRERPQLRSFGVDVDGTGAEEDWHAGSRKPPP